MKKFKKEESEHLDSSLFSYYRKCDVVCDSGICTVSYLGKSFFITTVVGKSFHVYEGSKQKLLFISKPLKNKISAMASVDEHTLVASGNEFLVYSRADVVSCITLDESIDEILVLGDYVSLLSKMENALTVVHWRQDKQVLEDMNVVSKIKFDKEFQACCHIHPDTYFNKVLVGGRDGRIQLWNVKTRTLIYEFQKYERTICSLVQTTALDVAAVGYMDGTIQLIHLKKNVLVGEYKQHGSVNAISFRESDVNMHMISVSTNGHITVWDLNEMKQVYLKDTGLDSIGFCSYIRGTNLILVASKLNAIQVWSFNDTRKDLTILKERKGLSSSASFVKFVDNNLVYTGNEKGELELVHISRDSHNRIFSKGKEKNLSLSTFSIPSTLHNEWGCLAGSSLKDNSISIWSQHNKIVSKVYFDKQKETISALETSLCSNFCAYGTSKGSLVLFNLQSSIVRCRIQAHNEIITGVFIDDTNQYVGTSSLDGFVKIWKFKDFSLLHSINIGASINLIYKKRESSFLAVSCDDCSIKLIDLDNKKVVRTFLGPKKPVLALEISNDNRLLLASSTDSTVCVFNIPSGKQVDKMVCEFTPKSISISPNDLCFSISYVDDLGFHLFMNKSFFESVSTSLPAIEFNNAASSAELIVSENESKWRSLINLDTIKKRNTPKEPPKKPENAPFFLSSASSVPVIEDKSEGVPILSDEFQFDYLFSLSPNDLIKELENMPISRIDLLIILLGENRMKFLKALIPCLTSKASFDMIMSILSRFLAIHGENIFQDAADEDLDILETVLSSLEGSWNANENTFQSCLNLLSMLC